VAQPVPNEAELERLLKELEIARLREEVAALQRTNAPKTLRHKIWNVITSGGLVLAAIGIGAEIRNTQSSADNENVIAACDRAEEAIRSGINNAILSQRDRESFIANKLRISQKCDRETQL
jgi:hypothetical protein